MSLVLYELAGADPALRFSPHCWKTRMALAHKGLEAERRPWRFTDKEMTAFSGQGLVPVLVDDGKAVTDSWKIALYLEEAYPERPTLFGGEAAVPLTRFVNVWADSTLVPAIARLCVMDILACAHPKDHDYFRSSREQRFGTTLEALCADQAGRTAELRQALTPLRLILQERPFVCGGSPAYADYCAFGMLMWLRCVHPQDPLEAGDPVVPWRERMLDLFDGMARQSPMVAAA